MNLEKIKNLHPSQKYIVAVSVLNEETNNLDTIVTTNKFLVADIHLARNEISKLLFDLEKKQKNAKGDKNIQSEVMEAKIKNMLS
jgi:hypothetical protein